MKRLLSLFLSCIFVIGICFCAPVTASAAESITQGDWEFVIDEEYFTAEIKRMVNSSAVTVEVPELFVVEAAEYAVKSIASGAFEGCESLTEISVEAGNTYFESADGVLVEIGSQKGIVAYPEAKSGDSYIVPSDVSYFKDGAFGDCENLKFIFYMGEVLELNDNASALEDVVFHYGVTDHNYSGDFFVDVSPTCSTVGSKSKHCLASGCTAKTDVTEIPVDPAAHDDGSWSEKTAPTCFSEGVMAKNCTLCGFELETNEIPKNDHSFGKWQLKKAPTCKADGEMVRKCTTEGCNEEETMPLVAEVDHIPGEWEIEKNPSCDEAGIRVKNCTVCDIECEREEIPAQHSFGDWEVVSGATCKEAGSKRKTCSACGETETEEIAKLPHTPGSWELKKDSTCAEKGEYVRCCTACGEEIETAGIEKKDHDFGEWVTKTEPTCTEVGIKEKVCGNCAEVVTEEIPALGHDFEEEFTVDTEATCTEAGSKSRHCSRCEEKTEVTPIPALDHDFEEEFTVDTEPTCTEAGSESRHCSRCEEKTEVKEIPATGHIDIELIPIKEETCLESGEYLKKCKCGEELGKVVTEPRGHTYSEWIIEKEATCTEAGSQYQQCTECEAKLKTEIIPILGHSFGEWEVTKEATCEEDGLKFRVCSVCEAEEESIIDKIAHKNAELVGEKEATCLEAGYTGDQYCPDCDRVLEKGEEIKALGHKAGEWITDKQATFTQTGTQHKECIRCGIELEKAIIDKLKLKTPVVKADNTTKGIKVSWNKDVNAATYNVYKKTYADGKWSGWKLVKTVKASVLSLVDTDVKAGVIYKYTVRAYNGKFKGGIKDSNTLICIKAPKVTIANSGAGVAVKWTKIANAKNYVVYRSAYAGGKWSSWAALKTVKGTVVSFTDKKAKSGVKYKYTVRAVNGESRSAYIASNELLYLAQPTLEISNGAAGIIGVWTQVNGATGYTIYRSEYNASTEKWTKWINLGTAKSTSKSFTDKTVKAGVQYKYTVRAIRGKVKSTYVASNSLIYVAQPVLKITVSEAGIVGNWNKVKGAEGYIVYRAELVKGKWTKWRNLGTAGASAKSFTDKTVKSGVTYRYTIRAKIGKYKSSYVSSNEAMFLNVPVVKVANAAKGVAVSWEKVDGAEKYIVYRSEYKASKWTKWAVAGTTEELKYVDVTAKNNVKYKYTVKAVSGKNKSLYKASGIILFVAAPSAQIEIAATGIKVKWTEVEKATGYTICRSQLGKDGKWTKWETMGTAKATKTAWIDKSAKEGVTYKYSVRALNGKTKSSYISSNSLKFERVIEDAELQD